MITIQSSNLRIALLIAIKARAILERELGYNHDFAFLAGLRETLKALQVDKQVEII